MSVDYGITDEGYIKPDLATILGEIFALAVEYYGPNIDLTPASILYIIFNVLGLSKEETHQIAEQFYNSLGISTSHGRALRMHGDDYGLDPKSGVKSTVTLTFTGTPGTTIPAGTQVSTGEGYVFNTIAEAEIPSVMEMTRGTTTSDQFSSVYSNIDSIDWIAVDATGVTRYISGTDYNFIPEIGTIDWSPAGTEPLAGVTYYVGIGESYSVDVNSRAALDGTEYNVPAETIITLLDSISGISAVTNDSAVTNGTDEETDDSYMKRLLNGSRRNWTITKIASTVDATDGVRASSTRWDHGITTSNISAESQVQDPPYLGQLFTVNEVINNISKITVNIRRYGSPGPLTGRLYRWRIDYATTVDGPIMDEILVPQNRIPTEDFEEVDFNVVATNVDSTYEYLFTIGEPVSADEANYYHLRCTYRADSGGMFWSGGRIPNANLYYKIWYHSASFTSTIAAEEVYSTTLTAVLDDNVDTSGRAVGIQKKFREATKVVVQVFMEVLLDEDYTLEMVEDGVVDKLQTYINALDIEEDVRIAEMIASTMAEPGVLNVRNVRMSANDVLSDVGVDIIVYEDEVAILGQPGVYITEIYE